jgi:glycerol uptake facilitator-like aquaporin
VNFKALAAELIGTFGLSLAVLVSINSPGFPVGTPVIAGLTLGLFVYTIGPISGCHINPAVTLALAAIRKVDLKTAGSYIVAQLLGAGLAMGVGSLLFAAPESLVWANSASVGASEALGAMVFLFGIAAVVLGRVPESMSGLVIGGSLMLGVLWAAQTSNGVLNPAVAFSLGSMSLAYVWGPILGGTVGALLSSSLAVSTSEING